MKTKTLTAPRLGLKRQELLNELREAIPIYRFKSNVQLLEFCNISDEKIAADCNWNAIPWSATQLHYYTLGIRAVRARARGNYPDGTFCGSINPDATTPTYQQIIISKQAEDTYEHR